MYEKLKVKERKREKEEYLVWNVEKYMCLLAKNNHAGISIPAWIFNEFYTTKLCIIFLKCS